LPALPLTVRFALASALLSHSVFLILLFGWGSRATFAAAAIACLAPAAIRTGAAREPPPRAALLALPYALLYLIHTLAPEIQPDGYTYHLALPREYVRLGGFPDRIGFYEMLPQGVEMLFTAGYAFAGQVAAKLIHFAFLLATVPLIAALGARLGLGATSAYLAALLYFVTPVVGISGTSAYNDAALVFFALASLYLLVDDRPFLLGLAAGFCYAIKPTGVVIAGAAVACFLARRRWRCAVLAALGAALTIAPWMTRNLALTGNPVAPLYNRVFPNPHFPPDVEESLARFLRDFGDLAASEVPLELAVRGAKLQGLIGPAFLVAPLALLALRRREGRIVLAAAMVTSVPWLFNLGARFLMPALALWCLALAIALPPRALAALVAVHAILSLPWAMDLYASPSAWRLHAPPWRAALRLEPERDYLRRELHEYPIAELIAQLPPGEPFLDLVAAPGAYFDAVGVAPWQSARGARAAEALELAAFPENRTFDALEARWPAAELAALRLRLAADARAWSIQEIEPDAAPNLRWSLEASANRWEVARALDRNPLSRWSSRGAARRGAFVEIDFGRAERLAGVRWISLRDERGAVQVEGRSVDGVWRTLDRSPAAARMAPRNFRRRAIALVRREGFRYILARPGDEGFGRVAGDLMIRPGDWGVASLGEAAGARLWRIEPPIAAQALPPP
jgi:hypothetical protein